MGKKAERIEKLIEILQVRNYVSVRELAKILNVSEMTVRRDLQLLEDNRVAENVDGTAVYNADHDVAKSDREYCLGAAKKEQDRQKQAIGRHAASMVEHDDIIILDTGTTTEHIVPWLPQNRNITAICYNMNILIGLRRLLGVKIHLGGGYYHPNTQMFECPESIQFVARMRAQKVFVSAAGVHEGLGVTCVNGYEVPMKQTILRSALQKILVVDSSKFGVLKPAYFCELEQIDIVVTDSGISEKWSRQLGQMGIELRIAPGS